VGVNAVHGAESEYLEQLIAQGGALPLPLPPSS
jgi:hypothetical protein